MLITIRCLKNNFTFEVLQEGNVKFYHTSFIIHKFFESANSNVPIKQTVDYNVYLRKDPRKLEKISFSGEMNRLEMMVLNDSGEFNCEGKGVIAIANMNQILNAIGTKVIEMIMQLVMNREDICLLIYVAEIKPV